MNYEYIQLAPGFARDVLDAYEAWEGKRSVPLKVQELMMVLDIEVSRRYRPRPTPKPDESTPKLRDTRLD